MNVIIDDFESDVITFENLSKANDLMQRLQDKYNCKEIKKLKIMIEKAIENKTLITFDF